MQLVIIGRSTVSISQTFPGYLNARIIKACCCCYCGGGGGSQVLVWMGLSCEFGKGHFDFFVGCFVIFNVQDLIVSVIVGACRRSRSRIHGRGLWIMDHGRRNKMEDFGVGELLGYRMIILGQKQLQKVKKSKSFIRVPPAVSFSFWREKKSLELITRYRLVPGASIGIRTDPGSRQNPSVQTPRARARSLSSLPACCAGSSRRFV